MLFLSRISIKQGELGITLDAYRWRTQVARERRLSPSAAFKEFRDTVRDLPYLDSDPERQDSIQLREIMDSDERHWLLRTGWSRDHVSARLKLRSGNNWDGHKVTAEEMIH